MLSLEISLRGEAGATVLGIQWRPLRQAKVALGEMISGLADWADSVIAFFINLPLIVVWVITTLILVANREAWRCERDMLHRGFRHRNHNRRAHRCGDRKNRRDNQGRHCDKCDELHGQLVTEPTFEVGESAVIQGCRHEACVPRCIEIPPVPDSCGRLLRMDANGKNKAAVLFRDQ
jgi:hypothetical protein